MSKYMIEAPHTKETCLQALDEVLESGTKLLDKFSWGCKAGVHTGWATLEVENQAAAEAKIPTSQRGNWRVTELVKFTPEQIEAAHQH